MNSGPPTERSHGQRPLRAWLVHGFRVGLVIALMWSIPRPPNSQLEDQGGPPPLSRIRLVWPEAARVESQADSAGLWQVFDAQDQSVGRVARTLPAAAEVVGYRGPSEALIFLDQQLNVAAVRLLASADTEEHVEAVVADELFFEQFRGWDWGGPKTGDDIDAVSGATLTSLALAEGVLVRIGGGRPSLVFPNELVVEEVQEWFPQAASIRRAGAISEVFDPQGAPIGRVVRSGIHSDSLIGYQGPSELLMRLSENDTLTAIKLRESYDNQPYVRYVRVEAGFWQLFTGKSLDELARLDPAVAGIEGVSGATMTSLAVAETIAEAARRIEQARELGDPSEPEPSSLHSIGWTGFLQSVGWTELAQSVRGTELAQSVRWTAADLITIGYLLLAAALARGRWLYRRRLRRLWLVSAVVVIGLWSGNLISLALIAGWSAEGIAWRLAPGLTVVATVAVLLPPLGKSNPYCNHLCPHGAVQQLIRPRRSTGAQRNWRPGKRLARWLSTLPGWTLVVAYVAVVVFPTVDLSAIEPFHAYLIGIAAWSAIAFCLFTLAVAAVLPMAYCRYGCPTGRLLDFLRRTARSDRIEWADLVAIALLAFALIYPAV